MEFDCITNTMDKVSIGPEGVKEPLCNNCCQPECTNPIRKRTVSIMGINRSWNLYVVGNQVYMVVACRGYTE